MSVLPVGFGGEEGSSGYTIANSVRFRASASASLSRTFATPTDIKKFTFSFWCKRGALGTNMPIMQGGPTGTVGSVAFVSDQIYVHLNSSVGATLVTTQLARDPSAWMSVVVALDTTQAAASDRAKLYINGAQVTSFASTNYPALNDTGSRINAALSHTIGYGTGLATYFDGYLSDVYFIDGQALDPTSFGQFNSDNVWTPKAYTGTYGTNGFYLKFNDGSNLTNLCLDRSGNGNNWTATSVSLTAGATYDWMVDTPSVNYCTLNPLALGAIFAAGNLDFTTNNSNSSTLCGTIPVSSGKWYWEVTCSTVVAATQVGIYDATKTNTDTSYLGQNVSGYAYSSNGQKVNNATATAYGATWTSGDVIGVALDMDAGTIAFYKNNAAQGTAYSGLSGSFVPAIGEGAATSAVGSINFGQRPFTYTPPTGFKALNTANLPAVTVTNGRKNFDVKLRTTSGASGATITGVGFQPDLLWSKLRNTVSGNILTDSVRGGSKLLVSDTTGAESTNANWVTSFNSDGYTMGSGDWTASNSAVEWLWKAGGAAVTNTAGSISSQVSANTAAGISIVTYTGNGIGSATVGHGLGVQPSLVILKSRSLVGNWWVAHKGVPNSWLQLETTGAAGTGGGTNGSINYQSTFTSSVFGFIAGSSTVNNVNQNTQTFVAYCFAEVAGFSRFGSYTGNGSTDGPFVFCGFRPRWVMVKRSDGGAEQWNVFDAARDPENFVDLGLIPNASNAEYSGTAVFDFTANGFKVRYTGTPINTSGATYVFAAFSENPFGGSNVAPVTAR